MIKLQQLNGDVFVVNADLVCYVHAHPDTVLTLTNGDKVMVKESMDDVIDKVIKFKNQIVKGVSKKEAT